MSLVLVEVSLDAYHACLEHVMFHQGQEMMGLLFGQCVQLDDGTNDRVIRFHASKVMKRKDKRPDRVEISPEDLSLGMVDADELNTVINGCEQSNAKRNQMTDDGDSQEQPLQVRCLGWYHSHPKITVWPSHVDLGTQAKLQAMDPHFVGLIFATYLETTTAKGPGQAPTSSLNTELVAFQSVRDEVTGGLERKVVPVITVPGLPKVIPFVFKQRKAVPSILVQEEEIEKSAALECLHSVRSPGGFNESDPVESDHALDRLLGAASTNLDAIVDHVMAPLLQQINMEKCSRNTWLSSSTDSASSTTAS